MTPNEVKTGKDLMRHQGCGSRTSCLDCPAACQNRLPKFQMVLGGEFSFLNFSDLYIACHKGGVALKPHGTEFDVARMDEMTFIAFLQLNSQRNKGRVVLYANQRKSFAPIVALIDILRYPVRYRIGKFGHGMTGVPTFKPVHVPKGTDFLLDCQSQIDKDEDATAAELNKVKAAMEEAEMIQRKLERLKRLENVQRNPLFELLGFPDSINLIELINNIRKNKNTELKKEIFNTELNKEDRIWENNF